MARLIKSEQSEAIYQSDQKRISDQNWHKRTKINKMARMNTVIKVNEVTKITKLTKLNEAPKRAQNIQSDSNERRKWTKKIKMKFLVNRFCTHIQNLIETQFYCPRASTRSSADQKTAESMNNLYQTPLH